jgi:hypothetical protein
MECRICGAECLEEICEECFDFMTQGMKCLFLFTFLRNEFNKRDKMQS